MLAVAFGLAVADGVAVAFVLADGVGVGVGVAAVAVFGAISSTSRNSSWAVVPTRSTTFWVFAPGTATLMMLLPCCWTCASVKPAPLTRLSMMFWAWVMSDANWADETPLGAWASSDTVVPLVRSRPSCTLKSWRHFEGCTMLPPTMTRNSTTMTTPSAASARPGRETFPLGGATSACPSRRESPAPGRRRGAAGYSAWCSPAAVLSAGLESAGVSGAEPFW